MLEGRSDRREITCYSVFVRAEMDHVHWANPLVTVQSVPELHQLNTGNFVNQGMRTRVQRTMRMLWEDGSPVIADRVTPC